MDNHGPKIQSNGNVLFNPEFDTGFISRKLKKNNCKTVLVLRTNMRKKNIEEFIKTDKFREKYDNHIFVFTSNELKNIFISSKEIVKRSGQKIKTLSFRGKIIQTKATDKEIKKLGTVKGYYGGIFATQKAFDIARQHDITYEDMKNVLPSSPNGYSCRDVNYMISNIYIGFKCYMYRDRFTIPDNIIVFGNEKDDLVDNFQDILVEYSDCKDFYYTNDIIIEDYPDSEEDDEVMRNLLINMDNIKIQDKMETLKEKFEKFNNSIEDRKENTRRLREKFCKKVRGSIYCKNIKEIIRYKDDDDCKKQ